MELGDLQTIGVNADGNFYSRNPRYNGIGWFTSVMALVSLYWQSVAILAIMELGDLLVILTTPSAEITCRNPRYNGIGWFTKRRKRKG